MSEGHGHRLLRAAAGSIAILLLIPGATTASAAVTGKAAELVVDVNTGAVLHQYKSKDLRYPASLTKMMTLYLVFEQIENRRLSYKTRITASATAAAQPPSRIGLKAGDRITVRQAVKALVTKSANDVATAIAEHIAGSESAFARMMTRKARQLGMSRTVFRNASGLPHRRQHTTARDMAQLALRLRDHFPRHFGHFRTRSFVYKGRTFRNHNVLLGRYQGVDGIKTGYTRASGFNLVSSLKRDGRHVVAVVMGGKTGRARNAKMRRLLSRQFPRASAMKTRRRDVRVALRQKPRRVARPALKTQRRQQPAPRRAVARAAPPAPTPLRSPTEWRPVSAPTPAPQVAKLRPPPRLPQSNRVSATPAIQIARVRRVDIRDPRGKRSIRGYAAPAQPIAATRTTSAFAPPAPPRVVGEYRAPAATSQQRRAYIAPSAPPRQPAFNTANTAYRGPAPGGARPSTLQAQAARLAAQQPPLVLAAAPQRVYRTQRSSLGGRATAGQYQIQVGAFFSADEAHRQLETISRRAGVILAGARPIAIRVASGNRDIYRARFSGFSSRGATAACNGMRQRRIDCFVARAN